MIFPTPLSILLLECVARAGGPHRPWRHRCPFISKNPRGVPVGARTVADRDLLLSRRGFELRRSHVHVCPQTALRPSGRVWRRLDRYPRRRHCDARDDDQRQENGPPRAHRAALPTSPRLHSARHVHGRPSEIVRGGTYTAAPPAVPAAQPWFPHAVPVWLTWWLHAGPAWRPWLLRGAVHAPAPGFGAYEQQYAGDHQRLQQAGHNLPNADPNRGSADFQLRFLHSQRRFLYGERGSLELGYANLLITSDVSCGVVSIRLIRNGSKATRCANNRSDMTTSFLPTGGLHAARGCGGVVSDGCRSSPSGNRPSTGFEPLAGHPKTLVMDQAAIALR